MASRVWLDVRGLCPPSSPTALHRQCLGSPSLRCIIACCILYGQMCLGVEDTISALWREAQRGGRLPGRLQKGAHLLLTECTRDKHSLEMSAQSARATNTPLKRCPPVIRCIPWGGVPDPWQECRTHAHCVSSMSTLCPLVHWSRAYQFVEVILTHAGGRGWCGTSMTARTLEHRVLLVTIRTRHGTASARETATGATRSAGAERDYQRSGIEGMW